MNDIRKDAPQPMPAGHAPCCGVFSGTIINKQGEIIMVNTKGDSGKRIADMIKKAMDDHQITTTEYEQIMMIADEDGVIDSQERRQLAELQHMIENGTIRRVPG
jgi:hypothetical protein